MSVEDCVKVKSKSTKCLFWGFKVTFSSSEPAVEFVDTPDKVEVCVGEKAQLSCKFRSSSLPVVCCWIFNRVKVKPLFVLPVSQNSVVFFLYCLSSAPPGGDGRTSDISQEHREAKLCGDHSKCSRGRRIVHPHSSKPSRFCSAHSILKYHR